MPTIIKNGIQYNVNPNAIGAQELTVTTPEVEVVGKAPTFDSRQSAFNRNELIQDADKILGNTVGKVIEPITKIPGIAPVLRTLTPSNWVGTIRTGVAPWSKSNEGFGTSKDDQALNSLFNYGMSVVPFRVNYGTPWEKLKYSKLGERARGIKITDDVYHGSRQPFDISKARTSNPNAGDSGFHVGDTSDPTLFMANNIAGGVQYKGKLQLKEPAFEVPDFGRWNPYQFWAYAKENKDFANYLQKHGLSAEDFGNMSNSMSKGVQQLADKVKNSGIALKYKNKYETLSGDGYSYYLSNPNQAHFTDILQYNKNRGILWIDPIKQVREASMEQLRGTNPYTKLPTDKWITIHTNFYNR